MQACFIAEVLYNGARAFSKKIHADAEQQHIYNARYNNPPPQIMGADKAVRLPIALESNNDIFKQRRSFDE